MSQKRGLGKGLGDLGLTELLSEVYDAPESVSASRPSVSAAPKAVEQDVSAGALSDAYADADALVHQSSSYRNLAVDQLHPGQYQPRRQFDEAALEELAKSITAQGLIQPIVVRPHREGYEIIAGERRWRAAQRAGLHDVPVIVRTLTDEAAMAMALIENIHRKDLNVMEEALALSRLVDEFQLTHEAIADAVGKSRASITNLLRLLNLQPEVRSLLESGDLEMGHARALLSLDSDKQLVLARIIVKQQLSVRQAEKLVRSGNTKKAKSAKPAIDPDILSLQNRLSEQLCAVVQVQHTPQGKGKLVVDYNSLEELEGILGKLGVSD